MSKYKSKMILAMILFIVGISEFFMLLMNIPVPSILVVISTILLFAISIFGEFKNKGLKILLYPLIAVYFLVCIPIIGKLVSNSIIYISIVIVSFIIVMIFLYNDLVISNKAKLK